MACSSEVMSQLLMHILKRVNFRVFFPFMMIIHWVHPESKPVSLPISFNVVVELNLGDSVTAQEEEAWLLSTIENTGFLVLDPFRDLGADFVVVHLDIRRLEELCIFPPTVACTRIVMKMSFIVISESSLWIDFEPSVSAAAEVCEIILVICETLEVKEVLNVWCWSPSLWHWDNCVKVLLHKLLVDNLCQPLLELVKVFKEDRLLHLLSLSSKF